MDNAIWTCGLNRRLNQDGRDHEQLEQYRPPFAFITVSTSGSDAPLPPPAPREIGHGRVTLLDSDQVSLASSSISGIDNDDANDQIIDNFSKERDGIDDNCLLELCDAVLDNLCGVSQWKLHDRSAVLAL